MTRNGLGVACLSLAATRNRDGEDDGGVPRASSDYEEFLLGVGRQGAQGFLSSVLKNKSNRLAQVRQTFFSRFALAVGAGYLGAVSDVPWAILLDDRRELIVHASTTVRLTSGAPLVSPCAAES